MTRSRAVLLHLWPSLLLLAVCAGLVLVFWYPPPVRQFGPGSEFRALLIIVGGMMGPALTWLVYSSTKSRLAMTIDLTVISVVQLVAMSWGMYTLYIHRPYYMVFTVDRFEVLSNWDVRHARLENPAFRDKPLRGLAQIYATMPTEESEYQKLLQEVAFEGKPDLQFRTEYWSPYRDKRLLALEVSRPLLELREARPASVKQIDSLVTANGGDISRLTFVPAMMANSHFATVLDASSGEVLDTLLIDPWLN